MENWKITYRFAYLFDYGNLTVDSLNKTKTKTFETYEEARSYEEMLLNSNEREQKNNDCGVMQLYADIKVSRI